MKEYLYNIRNLECSYERGSPVLYVPELQIGRGKLIFIIGRSGIGKSTFIETIGLMNNTISQKVLDSSVLFHDSVSDDIVDISEIWTRDISSLSVFRQRHFSFIFQNTNLMPNFSAGENMMMTLLFKGYSYEDSKRKVLQMMERVDLPPQIFNNHIALLSGGQRQRLAFVRAITAEFSVLFGDEPTGNLDRNTSEELISILQSQLKENNKTAVIVSHDLYLALKFADQVIPISTAYNSNGESNGIIEYRNIITKCDSYWMNSTGSRMDDPQHYLSSFLKR